MARPTATDDALPHAVSSIFSFANTDGYMVNENSGQYPLVIDRTNPQAPSEVCWGVTNKSDEAGHNFDSVKKEHVQFAAGQTSATVYVTLNDQGINGPAKYARAFLSCTAVVTAAPRRRPTRP